MSDPFHKYGFGRWYEQDGELKFEPGKVKGWESHFNIHFTPIIFFIVPFYLFFEGPLFLLYIQVLLVGLSAVPLYLIAKNVFSEKYIPIFLTLIYLFFRHLLIGLMHDVHMEMLFPFFILSAFYFIAVKKKPVFYFFFILLALMIKEDIAVYVFFFGLYIAFKYKEKKIGIVTSVISLAYIILVMKWIIPYFRGIEGMGSAYVYDHWGQGVGQMVLNIIKHPTKLFEGIDLSVFLRKFSNIVGPLLFLPFFSSFALLIIPPVFVAIMSKIPQNYTFGIHYGAKLLPFIFLSLIYGLHAVKKFFDRRNLPHIRKPFFIILVILLLINIANSNFWRIVKPSRYEALKDYKMVTQAISQIPPDASVAALSALIPHIPKRKRIFMLPEVNEADYILIHSGINLWPYQKEELLKFIQRIENEGSYKLIFKEGKFIIYKRTR